MPSKRAAKLKIPKAIYIAPVGFRTVSRIHTPLAWVKESTPHYEDGPTGAVVRKTFNALWQDYTKALKGKPVAELCIAVHPKWLAAALASPEMAGQQTKTNRGVMLYGLRVREDAGLSVDEIAVEEHNERGLE